jgi:hypothetical protein
MPSNSAASSSSVKSLFRIYMVICVPICMCGHVCDVCSVGMWQKKTGKGGVHCGGSWLEEYYYVACWKLDSLINKT